VPKAAVAQPQEPVANGRKTELQMTEADREVMRGVHARTEGKGLWPDGPWRPRPNTLRFCRWPIRASIVVPRLMRIQDAAKYLSATTWQVATLLREKVIPSFVLGKRRVVDRLELDRYVERWNAMARTEASVSEEEETMISLKKWSVVCTYPLLNVLLQTLRNPDHLFDFAMGDSSTNVVTAYVPLFPERIEGADELRIFP
jgi:excisionase family DNA binding protein